MLATKQDSIPKNVILVIDSCIVEHQYEGHESNVFSSIEIAGCIIDIPQWSFAIIPTLEEVRLRPTIQNIKDNAFFSCKRLTRINLEDVKTVGDNCFKNTSLKEINLSQTISIGDFAFANCPSLKKIVFSKNLKRLGDFAFCEDTSLVNCHVTADTIGIGAFWGCKNLENLTLEEVSCIKTAAFMGCNALQQTLDIPLSVKVIESCAFAGCINLKRVIIDNPNIRISEDAFEKHVSLIYKNINQNELY